MTQRGNARGSVDGWRSECPATVSVSVSQRSSTTVPSRAARKAEAAIESATESKRCDRSQVGGSRTQQSAGLSQQETSTALSVTGSPTPATTLTKTLKTGNVNASGNPLPNTTTTQNQTTNSSVTPTAPHSIASPRSSRLQSNLRFERLRSSERSDQSLLSDRNLQMLLDRALSDRIYPQVQRGHTATNRAGLQRVPRSAAHSKRCRCLVEVTLKSDPEGDISLVALMPQEKTYNAAALSSKSNAYGGAAMAGAFQVSEG